MITRLDIAAYLATQFSALAASVGQNADIEIGYAPDIDAAMRKLGVARADLPAATVEDGQEDDAFTLSEFYALRRFWRLMGDRVNHTLGETSFNFTNQRDAVKAMLDDALTRVTALGYDVTGGGWSVGYMNLDYIEPEIVW